MTHSAPDPPAHAAGVGLQNWTALPLVCPQVHRFLKLMGAAVLNRVSLPETTIWLPGGHVSRHLKMVLVGAAGVCTG